MRNVTVRHAFSHQFATLHTGALFDEAALSWRAVGILMYLMARPDGERTSKAKLIAAHKEGDAAVRTALNELRTAGYLRLVAHREADGKIKGWDWYVSPVPLSEDEWAAVLDADEVVSPSVWKSHRRESTVGAEITPTVAPRGGGLIGGGASSSQDQAVSSLKPAKEEGATQSARTGRGEVVAQTAKEEGATKVTGRNNVVGKTHMVHSVQASSNSSDYPPEFEQWWREHPRRDGPDPKREAFKAWRTRVREGIAPDVLLRAVRAYRAWCERRRIIRTEHVMQGRTFLGPNERWREWAEREEPKPYFDLLVEN